MSYHNERLERLMSYKKDFYHSPNDAQRILKTEFLRDSSPEENSTFTDIKIIIVILKVTGLLPIYEKVTQYEIALPNKTSEFYSFFIRGVGHGLTIFNLYNLVTKNSLQFFFSYRDTDNINLWIEVILSVVTYTMTFFICGRNAENFIKIINEILRVDREINAQYRITLDNRCKFCVKYLACVFICQAYIVGLKMFTNYGKLNLISCLFIGFYAIQNCLSTVFIVFAAALLCIIKVRFAYLNKVLTGYTYKMQQKIVRPRRLSDFTPMIKFPEDALITFRLHNKMLRIYKTINDCVSLILVSYMGYAFYTITSKTYNIFVQITTGREISPEIMQWGLAWLIIHSSLLALLSRSCGQVTEEANAISQILARVYGKTKEYQNIVDKFLTKSIRQEVQFTAYGFFIIDNSTLFKIFSAVTTYLVILIQFKQLEDSKV